MELRLFVFHHAGGSPGLYRDWPGRFPAHWQVRPVDVPARSGPSAVDTGRLVERHLHELEGELTGRFALFGHSAGASAAYGLARRLHVLGAAAPVWLGLSGRAAPRPRGGGGRRVPAVAGPARQALREAGPAPAGAVGPVDSERLPVALSAFGGIRDGVAPPARLAGWARRSTRFVGLHLFDGGHFYFQDDPSALTAQIADDIHCALALDGVVAAVPR